MTYASPKEHVFSRLHNIFSSCEAKEESPHAGLCNNNGTQIDFFHMKWFVCRWISKF